MELSGNIKNLVVQGDKFFAELEFPYKDRKLKATVEIYNKEIFDMYSSMIEKGHILTYRLIIPEDKNQ